MCCCFPRHVNCTRVQQPLEHGWMLLVQRDTDALAAVLYQSQAPGELALARAGGRQGSVLTEEQQSGCSQHPEVAGYPLASYRHLQMKVQNKWSQRAG